MAVINHLSRFSDMDSGVRDDMLEGAAYLLHSYHGAHAQTSITAVPETYYTLWYKMTYDRFLPPIPYPFPAAAKNTLDVYDLETENPCFIGGLFLGDFTSFDVPVVDVSIETVLSDWMATALAWAVSENVPMVYAYMHSVMKLISLYAPRVIAKPESRHLPMELYPYGL